MACLPIWPVSREPDGCFQPVRAGWSHCRWRRPLHAAKHVSWSKRVSKHYLADNLLPRWEANATPMHQLIPSQNTDESLKLQSITGHQPGRSEFYYWIVWPLTDSLMYPKEHSSSFNLCCMQKAQFEKKKKKKCFLLLKLTRTIRSPRWVLCNPCSRRNYDAGMFARSASSSGRGPTLPRENTLYLPTHFLFLSIFWEESFKVYLVIS